jgi:pimeloyl-ACP methyl ester carboxylesterase
MNERQMVQTGLGALAVRVRGEGPVAVLWHSLFVDDKTWNRVEEELARARRLVIITGPDHGASPDPGRRYNMDECAEAAADVLASLGIDEPVDWVGNAWGGHVGVVFAARWPERCRTLVTLGTPIQSHTLSHRLRLWVLLPLFRLFGPVGFIGKGVRDVLLSPTTRVQDPEAGGLVADCLRTMNRAALVNAVVSISLRRPDLTPRLSQIRCPTLFVTGSDHTDWTPEQARAAGRLLADGATEVIPNAAYLIPLEAPDRTVQLVRDFWTQALQRRGSGNDQHDKSNGDPDGAVANHTTDFEHDLAGLSGSPAITDNLMSGTVPHDSLASPETASRSGSITRHDFEFRDGRIPRKNLWLDGVGLAAQLTN